MIALGVLVLLLLIAMIVIGVAFIVWRGWRAWRQGAAIAVLTAAFFPVFLMTLTVDVSTWFPRTW